MMLNPTLSLATVLSFLLMAGCTGESPSSDTPSVSVLTDELTDIDDALLIGEVVEDDGCVVVIQSDTKQSVAVLWPVGTSVEESDGMWAVESSALDGPAAELGDEVRIGGGFRSGADAPDADIATSCRADEYWVAVPS